MEAEKPLRRWIVWSVMINGVTGMKDHGVFLSRDDETGVPPAAEEMANLLALSNEYETIFVEEVTVTRNWRLVVKN